MDTRVRFGWLALLTLICGGCMSGPLIDNPARVGTTAAYADLNPVYLPLGPLAYGMVFEHVLDVVDDYFEIAYASRYDGRIETFPRIAPGLEQPWKPGSPDTRQRLLASLQTIRHYARVRIQPANDGGFFVEVQVLKELEDLPRPSRSTAGAASFRSDNTVQRQFEVVDASVTDSSWIPIGRDVLLEQSMLQCIANFRPPAAGLTAPIAPTVPTAPTTPPAAAPNP